ncbi:RAMP superfamily CRISPR-associated protein [Actinomadura sp. NPDC048955]|uniref:RAMP superfamily CRISPR-associated protein n=1 Tax=Actinomadura sp. NPDC048955 TaxID=3158228 RepID=UPI0033FE1DC3
MSDRPAHAVHATAHQGLAIGGPAEVGFDKRSLPYVPGSTLRGALASVWIREHGKPTADNPRREEFIEIFERSVQFGPLLQEGTELVPLSAAFCKYPRTAECGDWSIDAAVDPDTHLCRHCHQGVETGKGQLQGVRVRRTLRAKLDEHGVPMDGHLFARHELERGLTYRGRLVGQHPWLTQERTIWLGGKTSTNGRTTVRVDPVSSSVPVPASRRPDGALVIRFTGPAVVVDDAGRPSLDPADEIVRTLGLGRDAVEDSDAWIRPDRVGGWHLASGLPKPAEITIAQGSVIVLHLREQPDPAKLRNLAVEGVGLRRIEGFGTVEVNPPPWRKAQAAPAPAVTRRQSVLDPLRERDLLNSEETVRWLLNRARRVVIERARNPKYSLEELFRERIPLLFDDAQAAAVWDLFTSDRLATATPMLERELDLLAANREDLV